MGKNNEFLNRQNLTNDNSNSFALEESKVIPVIEEHVVIDKKIVESGIVKIVKTVSEEEKNVDVPVLSEEVEVQRVAVDKFVDEVPQIRYEGDIMIIPVVQEEVVIEKRLKLVEELHVIKRKKETKEFHSVTLKKEDVIINRIASQNGNSTPS